MEPIRKPSEPDWVRLPKEGKQLCGLGRSFLRKLVTSKKIESVKLTDANTRGIILIYLPSLLGYLEALRVAQNPNQTQPNS